MNVKIVGAAVLASMLVAGCSEKQQDNQEEFKEEAVVTVNGEKLMRSRVNADVDAIMKAQGDKIPADQKAYAKQAIQNQVAQSFVIEKVLVSKAKKDGYTITDADRKAREDEFLKAVAKMPDAPKSLEEYFKKFPLGADRAKAEFENGILIDKMMKAELAKAPATDFEAEAKKIVDNVVSNNAKNATSAADAEKKIKELKAQLDKVDAKDLPAKFAELAKANSACPSSEKGGDLGAFTHGQMVKEFDEMAFKLPVNKVSDPVKTQFGYHLILTTKKIPAVEANGNTPATPEKVQASHILIKTADIQPVPKMEEVVEGLKKQNERRFMQEFVMKQVKAAKIEAVDDFKQVVPPSDEPAAAAPSAKPAAKTAVKPAAKAVEKKAVDPVKKATAPVEKPVKK